MLMVRLSWLATQFDARCTPGVITALVVVALVPKIQLSIYTLLFIHTLAATDSNTNAIVAVPDVAMPDIRVEVIIVVVDLLLCPSKPADGGVGRAELNSINLVTQDISTHTIAAADNNS